MVSQREYIKFSLLKTKLISTLSQQLHNSWATHCCEIPNINATVLCVGKVGLQFSRFQNPLLGESDNSNDKMHKTTKARQSTSMLMCSELMFNHPVSHTRNISTCMRLLYVSTTLANSIILIYLMKHNNLSAVCSTATDHAPVIVL